MALDAALTHPALLGGVFASFGQVESVSKHASVAVTYLAGGTRAGG